MINKTLVALILFFLVTSTLVFADTCSHKYDKSILPYPSRQTLCPDGAKFVDYLTGKSHFCEQGHVDHVIPTKLAYSLGICGDELKKFSQDRTNLRMTHSKINLEKSSKNPVLIAMRHGEEAEKTVEKIVVNVAKKYPKISVSKLKADALERGASKEIAMLYRQRNKALSIARNQRELKREIEQRIQKRLLAALLRNASLTAAETSTLIFAPVALGFIFLDLKDTCNNLKDLDELNDKSNSEGSIESLKDAKGICRMSKEEFLAFIGIDVKLQKCISARQESNEINPPECDGIQFNMQDYEDTSLPLKKDIELPDYD
jgi:hypothetical protein